MELVKGVVDKVLDAVSIPAMGTEEDVAKAKELVEEDATVYAALRAPPEFYELSCKDYCQLALVPCFCYGRELASRTLKSSLYIVSDKAVKVHVDPFEPPLGIGSPTRDIPELKIEEIKNVRVVRSGGSCWDPKPKTGLVFEESGLEFFISEPEKLEEVIAKVRQLKGGAEEVVAKVEATEEMAAPAADEGQSAAVPVKD